eukprot:scaffold16752_cov30-Tisochrysis_lutea.AAC.1
MSASRHLCLPTRQPEEKLRKYIGAHERVAAQVERRQLLKNDNAGQVFVLDAVGTHVEHAERRRDTPQALSLEAHGAPRRALLIGLMAGAHAGSPGPLTAQVQVRKTLRVLQAVDERELIGAHVKLLERGGRHEAELLELVVIGVDMREAFERFEASE